MFDQLRIEKLIACDTETVFKSLQKGRLFFNCSADSNSLELDFRPGGKYTIQFKNHKVTNFGEFLEIIPNKKIVFTWCQTFGPEQKPDTTVTIELFAEPGKTRLVLVHSGFKDQASCDNHYQGWNGGLTDLSEELVHGKLRLVRRYEASVEKLYTACMRPENFFGFMGDLSQGSVVATEGGSYQVPTQKGEIKGEFISIVPNQKVTFSWLMGCSGPLKDSKVSLLFTSRGDDSSALELIHEGLSSEHDQEAHRQGWDHVTTKLADVFS